MTEKVDRILERLNAVGRDADLDVAARAEKTRAITEDVAELSEAERSELLAMCEQRKAYFAERREAYAETADRLRRAREPHPDG